ncbi:DNA gyrase subunit A (fragment) [Nostocoides jenkinsii Ben 74]|uniref:DNA gyrase subunit A n=1 Tax=Nostocoides jenkinsii Ben 74 TaxID=1193518 RepID=A0A077M8R3_9MICO
MVRLSALELPTLPATAGAPNLSGGAPITAYVDLGKKERVLTIAAIDPQAPSLALGTAHGVVKRVVADYPVGRTEWEAIALKDGDELVGAVELGSEAMDMVFITAQAQLLRFPASAVRPQGRAASGMAGIRLGSGDRAIFFGAVGDEEGAVVVTASGSSGALPGTEPGSLKVTPYAEYPAKGRGTGGVRAHRFLKGEDQLILAWAGATPARASAANGVAIELPAADGRRDGSGTPAKAIIAAISGPVRA